MTTLFLADDHEVVRRGLRALLTAERDFRVVGETGDGLEVVSEVHRLQPDLLVLDLMMPGTSGFEITRQVVRRVPRTRILVLSIHGQEAYVREALRSGARGYVVKDTAAEQLVLAVREVAGGRRFVGPQVPVEEVEDPRHRVDPLADPYDSLTPRERQVLLLAADGSGNAAIGQRLGISPRTVEVHRAHALHKLGIGSQTELVRYAIRRGLVLL